MNNNLCINILLLVIIGYVLYMIHSSHKNIDGNIENNKNKLTKESFYNSPNHNRSGYFDNNITADDIVDDVISWDDSYESAVITKSRLNSNFLNIKFHNDYRDVMTALNNLVPDRKQFFNLPNEPLNYSEPEVDEVKNMVKDFVSVLNQNLVTQVPSYRNPNSGWDEAIPDPKIKSGWDKVQESLGLPTSLYEDPASKAHVKLISVRYVQKYETEDEIKYNIDMILQKDNVNDQIIIKASFVQDKRPLHDENYFFKTRNIDMKVTIEQLTIVGYLSNDGDDAIRQFDGDEEKWYDYNKMEYNNMTDPKYIQRILMEKYRQRTEEMEQRNAMLDEEGQQFHKELPHVYDFSNIKGTQTIFDDMNYHREFS